MNYEEITVTELAERLDADATTVLIDVRQPDEFRSGHVPSARLIPLGTVADHLDELRQLGPLLLICRSGARSGRACELLVEQGLDATNVAGGTLAWVESGRATEVGDQVE